MMKQAKRPWQLQMYDRSLKKKMKVRALKKFLGEETERKCLLITCGDNNGAINYHLGRLGGEWAWAEFENDTRAGMQKLLNAPVHLLDKAACRLPFADASFDLLVCIDVHEHLQQPELLAAESFRVLKPGGRAVVTTPNGNERKLVVRLKRWSGMNNLEYGHVRTGFDIPDLEELLSASGLRPVRSGSYAKFFTEFLELLLNWTYVKVLDRKRHSPGKGIAPSSLKKLKAVKKSYRLYAFLYPFFWLFSRLDGLLFFSRGYAVIVEACKPSSPGPGRN
ncbi:MAG: methyltransferase domain-containing protein [Candidatus Aminicenantes bacterium]|nr:methyltransferase domain-containing protein [Candidatus Aminicenantes bacterium]